MAAEHVSGHGSRDTGLAHRIVDEAIALAEETGWENVRLRHVAARLDVSLTEVAAHYRDLDAIADAWLDRARLSLVVAPGGADDDLDPPARIYAHLMQWFDALAPHREVTVQMLKAKLWPFHPHHFVPMVFNLSRTVLWLRDAAGLDAEAPRREVEEVALTWLFLATLAVWSRDDTLGQERTRRFLRGRLRDADRAVTTVFGRER